MPIYEFHCDGCDATFERMTRMSARDERVACPECGSKKTGRKLSVVNAGSGAAATNAEASGGHVHSGMCGCGRMKGTCH